MIHTTGPWKVTVTTCSAYVDARVGNGMLQEVAYCGATEHGHHVANANLIAAAPDLLHACKDILDFLYRSGYDTALVKAAISKAEGK